MKNFLSFIFVPAYIIGGGMVAEGNTLLGCILIFVGLMAFALRDIFYSRKIKRDASIEFARWLENRQFREAAIMWSGYARLYEMYLDDKDKKTHK